MLKKKKKKKGGGGGGGALTCVISKQIIQADNTEGKVCFSDGSKTLVC